MPHLILSGDQIIAAASSCLFDGDAWVTPDAVYPRAAGVTGVKVVAVADLPADFAPERYVWRDEKLVPRPAPPPPVPASVTPLQARRALLAAGLLDQVEAAVKAAPRDVQIAWEYAISIERDDPTLVEMAHAIGLTDEQLDDLFRAAAQM